jgi:hypothetical protein
MLKRNAVRTAAAAAIAFAASTARAVGESTGTEAVSEMQFTGGQFVMMVAGLGVLGGVIWVVAKFMK